MFTWIGNRSKIGPFLGRPFDRDEGRIIIACHHFRSHSTHVKLQPSISIILIWIKGSPITNKLSNFYVGNWFRVWNVCWAIEINIFHWSCRAGYHTKKLWCGSYLKEEKLVYFFYILLFFFIWKFINITPSIVNIAVGPACASFNGIYWRVRHNNDNWYVSFVRPGRRLKGQKSEISS